MFLGFEIGGSKIQVGIGDGQGTIFQLWRGRVDRSAGAAGIRAQLVTAVAELRASRPPNSNFRAVGIGFGGPIDDDTRSVLKSHHVAGWDGFPLAEWAENEFRCPGAIGNDADVAGLGEALFGAGKGLSPIFYMTIGSGIGGGLIVDRRIYRGCGKGAAEVGHLRIGPAGATLESLCSGWSLEEAFGKNRSCSQLALDARRGDPEVIAFLDERWNYLAEAICQMIALLCPRRIIIGGGVSLMGDDVLFEPLRKKVAQRVFRPFANCCDIVASALGEDVVVHGALALARMSHE